MVKSLVVMGITDSDFPMSSMTGKANLLLTTSTGGGVHAGIKRLPPDRSNNQLSGSSFVKTRRSLQGYFFFAFAFGKSVMLPSKISAARPTDSCSVG
ncbi:hypothetical protein AV903_16225 [Erwinia tracheiphila]|uniref:Uncharacterized protein n=1 Tax=Erwinia tracheiphila TaxID=65700 RepID=A0A345CUV9_9GAMM|nr:hypothetical protein AV903_16225 [Erwinia tracheiphila]